MIQLLIQNGGTVYEPPVQEGITWETERKGVPGRLSFRVLADGALNFTEGNAVRLSVDGVNVFYGFVFQKKRNKEGFIDVVAYDQLRYLKNKDTYVYENKTAADVVRMIADDFGLQCGTLEDTGFTIESRVEDNKTLFDIIQTAIDLTVQHTTRLYCLYDDVGKLTLRNVESMRVGILIDAETGQNFEYASSIDGETYNKIKLSYENEEEGKRDIYVAQDSSHINEWGVLQYYESIKEDVNGKAKADALLSLYNQKTRNLTIDKAFGDVRIRAGASVAVSLDLGDITVNNFMVVEKARHLFEESSHTMDLTLRGGEFVG